MVEKHQLVQLLAPVQLLNPKCMYFGFEENFIFIYFLNIASYSGFSICWLNWFSCPFFKELRCQFVTYVLSNSTFMLSSITRKLFAFYTHQVVQNMITSDNIFKFYFLELKLEFFLMSEFFTKSNMFIRHIHNIKTWYKN